ncbi:CCA tRNA nucleotidyltransferase [Neorhizobium sp. JUb45]|uniref:CCA tRNA nucleotidyltransferase n=1 Tax=unclassified Neorhizobium TaxID=2629175 RepID=UPI001050480A|nr:CCA tRNA nucleotidyltransferase [Neorhizobium sp. JUb45]TCR06835.1 poly(A) polymerase [Neorhizobium sp. JUb45]
MTGPTNKNIADEDWFNNPALKRVLDLLNGDGGETRIVGGAVRNALMGLAIQDVDLATTLLPTDTQARAKAAGIKSVPTGIAHGTVTLVVDGQPFEVTTLRRDVSTDGRHAEVAFGTDWQADAERRDFTINALYADREGNVVDLVKGLADIETRTIRFIGDAATRIAEDHLRSLRFFRFFAYYGSGRPDADGLRAVARAKDKLSTLSAERIWAETKKLLTATDPSRALLWMRQTGVLTEILPETEKWGIDSIHGVVATEAALNWKPDPLLRLAAIVPVDAPRLAEMAKRLRMANAEAARLESWATAPALPDEVTDVGFDRILYRSGRDGLIMQLKLALASARANAEGYPIAMRKAARLSVLLKRAENFEKPIFPLSGGDVIAAGMEPGPKVGALLAELETLWVERNFSLDRAALTARLADLVGKAD